jgi:hypothetical protein
MKIATYIPARPVLADKAQSCQSLREIGTSDDAPLVVTPD